MQRRRKEKDVNGNMLREYVMLPARSRISLSCTPDVADGFLNIRRM